MAVWDDVLPDTDRKVFEAAGRGRPAGPGRRPVLLVIDVNDDFVGDRPGLFDAEFPAVRDAGGVAR